MNEEFIAKQKRKKIIAALLCICVAGMHGRMGSLDIAPCTSSSGSSTNMIEIFNEMYVQDADRNSGSSAFLRPNCAAHGTLHMNRSTRRSNTVTTDNC
jgi:hypothetical protein